jgi:hypothetical protein
VVNFGSFEDFLVIIENFDFWPRESQTTILKYRLGEQKFDYKIIREWFFT